VRIDASLGFDPSPSELPELARRAVAAFETGAWIALAR
jgi:hypothetical protein